MINKVVCIYLVGLPERGQTKYGSEERVIANDGFQLNFWVAHNPCPRTVCVWTFLIVYVLYTGIHIKYMYCGYVEGCSVLPVHTV